MIHYATEEEVYNHYKKDEGKIVIYKNSVYDVSGFINEHPGGPQKLEEYFGKNIEKPFVDESHSKYATRVLLALPKVGEILSKDLQDKLEVEIDLAYKKSYCCSFDYVVKKLFTHEDPVYMHKALGIFALVSFIYRYLYVFPM
jgi:cytochrome b involved in lipid metabolism